MAISLFGAAAIAVVVLAVPHRSVANTAFADATTTDPNNPTPCAACHYRGRENEGRQSLTDVGQQFFQNCRVNAIHDCHTLPQLSMVNPTPVYPSPQPTPYTPPYTPPQPTPYTPPYTPPQPTPYTPPQPYYPQPQPSQPSAMATAKFEDTCQSGDTFVIIRPANGGAPIDFQLKKFHKVHIRLPIGSTYAKTCGSWPAVSDAVYPVKFE